jgi:hypothetical protein
MPKFIPVGRFRHPWKTISWRGYVSYTVYTIISYSCSNYQKRHLRLSDIYVLDDKSIGWEVRAQFTQRNI